MGPDYSEMIQKDENMIINNPLIVGDSFGEKSCNGDNSSFINDKENLNNSESLSEELNNSTSDDQISDTDCRDVKYIVTAGNSPLSVVIKRCNNFPALSEDSCSNTFDRVYKSPATLTLEKLKEANYEQSDSEYDMELNEDIKMMDTHHQSKQSTNASLINKPCAVMEYVETIKSLIDMGLDVSESDQYDRCQVIIDGSKSLVEILQGSQPSNAEEMTNQPKKLPNIEESTHILKSYFPSSQQEQSEEVLSHSDTKYTGFAVDGSQPDNAEGNSNQSKYFCDNEENSLKSNLSPSQREQIDEVLCNSDTINSGLAVMNDYYSLSPNAQVDKQSTGSPSFCKDNLPFCASESFYVVLDDGPLQSTNTEARELEVQTQNCFYEDSNSSLKSDLQPETANFQLLAQTVHRQEESIVQSDSDTFDLQLEATNYFDETSLIDSGVDRIVYSPTLFSDDEVAESSLSQAPGAQKKSPSDIFFRRSRNTEARRLKHLQRSMIGLPPPPSVTNPQLSLNDLLRSLQENESAMSWPGTSLEEKELYSKHLKNAKGSAWPDSTLFCHPDIYYNNGVRSEQFASISQKFVQRYVGAETACFCNAAGTTGSARKRNKKLGLGFSPGRRLSHLARRRKAFSRDNLLSTTTGSVPKSQPNALAERRQIVIATKTKIFLNRPVTSKPSLNVKSAVSAGSRALSHKRALFQSPDKSKKNTSAKKSLSGSKRKNNFRSGVESFKRALFGSASKDSKDKELPDVKRSRSSDTHLFASSSKRKLLFDNVEGPSKMPAAQVTSSMKEKFIGKLNHPGSSSTKADTKCAIMNSGHKKKLLWAVAESLRKKGITMSHALFRPCASSLARICRSLLPDLQRHSGSTSELMLEMADKYANDIVREKKAEANVL